MIRIEADLPPEELEIYKGIEFVAKPSDSYSPQKSADKFAEFLEALSHQIPYDVAKRLKKDPRVDNFRSCLQDRV